jgi:NADH dehydrogenase
MADAQRERPHRIVIVGGGAGGLELATRLGDKLGRRGKAEITLIEKARAHLWKPLLHEIAAGSMDLGHHELDYLAQAHWHHFRYRTGEMIGLDRSRREVLVGPVIEENGTEVTPARGYPYDTLVLAVGSLTNDFGTPGVAEHAICLETPDQAARFHRRLVNACLRAQNQNEPLRPRQLQVAIIGAGATGVELAAELHKSTRELVAFGLDRIDPDRDITLHLIEAADRILPALPPRIAKAATDLLSELGVKVYTSARVAAVVPNGVKLADGRIIDAELVVWAAGVKAPAFLQNLDGLETNAINQLVVRQTLRTTRDDDIFAIGDCAACPWPERNGIVPPRAQAAHQFVETATAKTRRPPDRPVALSRLRLIGVARRIQHRRQLDGQIGRSELVRRRLFCAVHVCVALQNARIRAARLHQGRARHRRAPHQPAHRPASETALRAFSVNQQQNGKSLPPI